MNRRHFLALGALASVPRFVSAESSPDAALEEKLSGIMETYLKDRGFPGGQLAVGRGGKILLSKGFGLADRDKNLAVQPRTLFRIASVSKPLTAVATLVLVEEGRLSLDAKMLEVLQPDIFLPEGKTADARLKDITIRQLLQHTAGWNRDKSGDVMFEEDEIAEALGIPLPVRPKDVIREALGRPLDFDPGAQYSYSNFGYCVLGRIIEKLSGEAYEKFVLERVLKPAGSEGPRLGKTLTQAEGESRYYAPGKDGREREGTPVFPGLPDKVPWPYGTWCLETLDAHGGWISSAEDMVRFGMSLDDIGKTSPFKKRETWDTLILPPPGAPGHDKDGKPKANSYGCGFSLTRDGDKTSIDHSGSLPGTTTFLWKRADGFTWAAFFNQRSDGRGGDGAIEERLNKALDGEGLK